MDIEIPAGLTVVTDTLECDSFWLLEQLADGYFVTFRHSPPRAKARAQSPRLDLSSSLFQASSNKFSGVSLEAITSAVHENNPAVLVLEHPDVLVSSGLCTAAAALKWLGELAKNRTCIVSLSVHPALNSSLCKNTAAFVLAVLHQCHLQLRLGPLSTGHSKDFSGVLEELRGPLGESGRKERTWLVKRDLGLVER